MNLFQKLRALPDALSGRLFIEPERNGEYRFARRYLRDGMTVFDVGANVGDYASTVSTLASIQVHCFEPIQSTFLTLQQRLRSESAVGRIVLNKCALSDRTGTGQMYLYAENAGSNSLHFHDYHASGRTALPQESISLTTLDDYVSAHAIKRIDLLKVDVEGHEVNVIRGATRSLESGSVKCLQFEYNDYWQRSGHSLAEMLNLLRGLNAWHFFRLTPWGKWRLGPGGAPDDFKHSNYLAVLEGS